MCSSVKPFSSLMPESSRGECSSIKAVREAASSARAKAMMRSSTDWEALLSREEHKEGSILYYYISLRQGIKSLERTLQQLFTLLIHHAAVLEVSGNQDHDPFQRVPAQEGVSHFVDLLLNDT